MSKQRDDLDRIARQYPLGTCVRDTKADHHGWVVSWTLHHDPVWIMAYNVTVDIVCGRGNCLHHANPSDLHIVSRAEVDSANLK